MEAMYLEDVACVLTDGRRARLLICSELYGCFILRRFGRRYIQGHSPTRETDANRMTININRVLFLSFFLYIKNFVSVSFCCVLLLI